MRQNEHYQYPSIHHRLIGYPYRVWIFTILASPALMILWNLIIEKEKEWLDGWFILDYFLSLVVLTAFSAPSMVLYMLAFWGLINSGLPTVMIKFILFITAATGLFLTGLLLAGGLFFEILIWVYDYLIVFFALFLILSLVLKLNEK